MQARIRRARVKKQSGGLFFRATAPSADGRILRGAPKTASQSAWSFLSIAKQWYIIAVRRISSRTACISSAEGCISLRNDDIQDFVLMIYNSCGIDDIHASRDKKIGQIPKGICPIFYRSQRFFLIIDFTKINAISTAIKAPIIHPITIPITI